MARVALLYSTVDGHTLEICRRLARGIESEGHDVSLTALQPGVDIDVTKPDRIVIGASIRYGRHRPEVTSFIERNVETLRSKPGVFFSVNLVARKPEKREPHTNPYVRKFLRSISWQPDLVTIFAGKLDYPSYGFFDRNMIRLIMWMTGGPTDPGSTIEFTDWEQVDALAATVAAMGSGAPRPLG
jgi:menaquinone-dependent protoporphyrinogen oxidase